MIDRDHDLPVCRQATALGVSRGAVYYKPRPMSAADLKIMRRLDELHLDYPFAGSRMLRDFLNREGVSIGRRHVTRLMKRMGISAIYRRPNTSKPAPGHKIYPYLLRGLKIERVDQVWAMDITYIPMARATTCSSSACGAASNLKAYDSVSEARASLADYLAFYNQRRPHSSLDRRTPDKAYFERTSLAVAA